MNKLTNRACIWRSSIICRAGPSSLPSVESESHDVWGKKQASNWKWWYPFTLQSICETWKKGLPEGDLPLISVCFLLASSFESLTHIILLRGWFGLDGVTTMMDNWVDNTFDHMEESWRDGLKTEIFQKLSVDTRNCRCRVKDILHGLDIAQGDQELDE